MNTIKGAQGSESRNRGTTGLGSGKEEDRIMAYIDSIQVFT